MINQLINKNRWDKILELVKSDHKYLLEEINGYRNLLQIASANGEKEVVRFALSVDPALLGRAAGSDGQSSLHLMALNGNVDMLKECLKRCLKEDNEELVNLVDGEGNTVLHLLYDNYNFLKWVFGCGLTKAINSANKFGETVLTKNIRSGNNKIVEFLINEGVKVDEPIGNPPLLMAITLKHESLVKFLIEVGANVNIVDNSYISPLLLATYHNLGEIIELLFKKGAVFQYNGDDNRYNHLKVALINNNFKIANTLVDHNYSIDYYDKNIETSLHFSFGNKMKLPADLMSKMILFGDLNIQNVNGDTPLHFLLKNYKWENYNKFLEKKKLDIFAKNIVGRTPLSFVNNNRIGSFLNVVVNSYLNQSKTNKQKKNKRDKFKVERYRQTIKDKIMSSKRSFPENEIIKIKMIDAPTTINTLFNSDVIHNMIYTVIILNKHKNLSIPYQYFLSDKVVHEKILQLHNDLYRSPEERVVSDLVKMYTDLFYEIVPYLIVWRSETQYYINKDLKYYLQRCLTDDKIRFIFFKLTLVPTAKNTHANIIIFDKKTGILERFEPYGYVPYLNSEKLDKFLENKLTEYLDRKIIYVSPEREMVGPQTISDDDSYAVRKLGDPAGFCLAWTYWYLELRLANPDLDPTVLLKEAIKEINVNTGFIELIRNYANQLDGLKNDFMLSAGVSSRNIYDMTFSEEEENKILKKLVDSLFL